MTRPEPRQTQIFESKTIKGLFYEGFKKESSETTDGFDLKDLVVAFHYKGRRFDLDEEVKIPKVIRDDLGWPLVGTITGIRPDLEDGEQNRVVEIQDVLDYKNEFEYFRPDQVKKV